MEGADHLVACCETLGIEAGENHRAKGVLGDDDVAQCHDAVVVPVPVVGDPVAVHVVVGAVGQQRPVDDLVGAILTAHVAFDVARKAGLAAIHREVALAGSGPVLPVQSYDQGWRYVRKLAG